MLHLNTPPCHRAYRNAFVRWFGRAGLRLLGWQIEGQIPAESKLLVCGAPHTSNWDFVIAMLAVMALDVNAKWLAKHTLFHSPLRKLFFWLGGVPVDRSRPQGVVEQVAEQIVQSDTIIIGLMPEGTRKKTDKFKTGFLRIAYVAKCPILIVALDYRAKKAIVDRVIEASDQFEQQAAEIKAYYRKYQPRHPENF